MTFQKPKDVTYTQMAIYIDEHVYEKDCDDALIYEYIYHLVEMLAFKRAFFKSTEQYDNFSLITATRIFYRLRNKDQFVLLEDGTYKLSKVKSILNYIKRVIYPLKVKYEQETYSQEKPYSIEEQKAHVELQVKSLQRDYASNKQKLTEIDLKDYLSTLTTTIRNFLKTIPIKNNSSEWLNIYISCLLSFLNLTTLNNKSLQRLNNFKQNHILSDKYLEVLYDIENEDFVILYHLDYSMRDYIFVLVNQLKNIIIKDIIEIKDQYDNAQELVFDFLYKNIEDNNADK